MSSKDKIKTYKNHERNKPIPHTPYVPQYQIKGVDPKPVKSAMVPEDVKVATKPQQLNPRLPKPPLRQPYADPSPSPVGRGKAPLPNVGNNIEHLWTTSGVDEGTVNDMGDLEIDEDHPLVDNNDVVADLAYKLPPTSLQSEWYESSSDDDTADDNLTIPSNEETETSNDASEVDLVSIVRDLEEDDYLLLASGIPICSGPHQEIEEQAKAMFFGEHEVCNGKPISDSDIIIIKRVSIKVGLFIE